MSEFYLGLSVGSVQTIIGHPLDTIKTNFQNNSKTKYCIFNLYRGLSYPLTSSAIVNGFLFYSNNSINNFTKNNFVSGFVTGTICSPLINIFETLKIKEQLNKKQCITKLLKYSKMGFSATLLRESIGTSIYFGSYNYLKKDYNAFVSGSIAGASSWLLTYPFDVIKSRLQSGNCKTWVEAIKLGNFSNGLLVCLLRSFIVNGFSFSAYEFLKRKESFI